MAINTLDFTNRISFSIPDGKDAKSGNNKGVVGTFNEFLNNAINEVSALEKQADSIAEEFAIGKTDNIHQVMIASQKADIALQFTMQVRNKILDAYNVIMRIQI